MNWVHRRFLVVSVVFFSFSFLIPFCVCLYVFCVVCESFILFYFVSELSIHKCSFNFPNVYIIGFDFNFSTISSTLFSNWIYFVGYVDFLYVCFILPSLNRNIIKFLGYRCFFVLEIQKNQEMKLFWMITHSKFNILVKQEAKHI